MVHISLRQLIKLDGRIEPPHVKSRVRARGLRRGLVHIEDTMANGGIDLLKTM